MSEVMNIIHKTTNQRTNEVYMISRDQRGQQINLVSTSVNAEKSKSFKLRTGNNPIHRIKHRLHFLDAFVVAHEDKTQTPFHRPSLLDTVVAEELGQLLVGGGGSSPPPARTS